MQILVVFQQDLMGLIDCFQHHDGAVFAIYWVLLFFCCLLLRGEKGNVAQILAIFQNGIIGGLLTRFLRTHILRQQILV